MDHLSSFFVRLLFTSTDTDKDAGNREVVTQTPASESAAEEDNSLGYKGMGQTEWYVYVAFGQLDSVIIM